MLLPNVAAANAISKNEALAAWITFIRSLVKAPKFCDHRKKVFAKFSIISGCLG